MNAKTILQTLEKQDMDRRDFLKYSGMFVLGIVGSRTFLGMFLPQEVQLKPNVQSNESRGFGRSRYGV